MRRPDGFHPNQVPFPKRSTGGIPELSPQGERLDLQQDKPSRYQEGGVTYIRNRHESRVCGITEAADVPPNRSGIDGMWTIPMDSGGHGSCLELCKGETVAI